MANAFVLRNVIVGIDGVDLSDHIKEVQVVMTAADIDVTAMGAGGKQHLAGIRNDSFTFTAYSDFAASKIHATINPKFVGGRDGRGEGDPVRFDDRHRKSGVHRILPRPDLHPRRRCGR
jgi:hypothetical protein